MTGSSSKGKARAPKAEATKHTNMVFIVLVPNDTNVKKELQACKMTGAEENLQARFGHMESGPPCIQDLCTTASRCSSYGDTGDLWRLVVL